MKVSSDFFLTRQPLETIDRLTLRAELNMAGWNNYNAYNAGYKTSRYHFHLLNAHNIALTVVITKDNCLMLRGIEYKNVTKLFLAIDTYKN
jgi:hypothetical protein